MSHYHRFKIPGATVFLTINLLDRGSSLWTRHINILREVTIRTRNDKPFGIGAWVVLPDHMHCLWTLPEGDCDYSNRVGMLKARFSREMGKISGRSGVTPTPAYDVHGTAGGRARQ